MSEPPKAPVQTKTEGASEDLLNNDEEVGRTDLDSKYETPRAEQPNVEGMIEVSRAGKVFEPRNRVEHKPQSTSTFLPQVTENKSSIQCNRSDEFPVPPTYPLRYTSSGFSDISLPISNLSSTPSFGSTGFGGPPSVFTSNGTSDCPLPPGTYFYIPPPQASRHAGSYPTHQQYSDPLNHLDAANKSHSQHETKIPHLRNTQQSHYGSTTQAHQTKSGFQGSAIPSVHHAHLHHEGTAVPSSSHMEEKPRGDLEAARALLDLTPANAVGAAGPNFFTEKENGRTNKSKRKVDQIGTKPVQFGYPIPRQNPLHSRARRLLENAPYTTTACKCKNSQCLKLYCSCFQSGSVCNPSMCSCKDCNNTMEHSTAHGPRELAIFEILKRRPEAFDPRPRKKTGEGCSCKKTRCLRKYCDCFANGNYCSSNCGCSDCANTMDQRGAGQSLYTLANYHSRTLPYTTGYGNHPAI